jgi:hypothetical protein
MKLEGANPAARMVGEDELIGKTNYFIGNEPSKWRRNIDTYGKIKYEQIYPGIDLAFYGDQNQLEYDFLVGVGGDPQVINLSFDGVEQLSVDRGGELLMETRSGFMRQHKPVVYQDVDGSRRRIACNYVVRSGRRVGFELGEYDHSKPLVIDPVLTYSTFLGGTDSDFGRDIFVDSNGNAYITGRTASVDFPLQNPKQTTRSGFSDVFITKLNASGTAVIYSTYLGGSGSEFGSSIAVDSNGNAYVGGYADSNNFPTVNPIQPFGGFIDCFITKLDATGANLVYSTYLGGTDYEYVFGLALDATGSVYVTGFTQSTDFPTTNPLQASRSGGSDAFVTKLNPSGNSKVYSTYLGGNSYEEGDAIAVDSAGNAYITGYTYSSDFPRANASQPVFGGSIDAFVSKLSANGTALVYSTFLGGFSDDSGRGIAIDSSGNAYVCGNTQSSNFPTLNPAQPALNGFSTDSFVTKLNASGTISGYSTFLGGAGGESAADIAVDSAGNAYMTGSTSSTDFPVIQPLQPSNGGSSDVYITKLSAANGALVFSTYLGGFDSDVGEAIAVNAGGSIFVTGSAGGELGGSPNSAIDFPTTQNAFQTGIDGENAFVARIDPQLSINYVLRGKIVSSAGPLAGIKVTLTGSQSRTTLTDSNGNYAFQVLGQSGNYTVTPTSPSVTAFNPSNRNYLNLSADHTDVDFALPPPTNDNFANAQVITNTGSPINGTNISATLEPGETTLGSASVWYRWQAPTTGGVVLNYDTKINEMVVDVFTGSSVNALTRVSGQSSLCSFFSCNVLATSFKAIANTVYLIRVASSPTGTGNFAFSFSPGVTISGNVKNINGRNLTGASVRATRMDNLAVTTTGNTSDGYSLVVSPGFSYDVLAILSPVNSFGSSIFNNLTQDVGNVNFTASSPTITITGFLNNMTSSAGVSIAATGTGISSKPCEIIFQGGLFTYKCSSLSIYGDYTVVPTSSDYTFSPTTRTFINAPGDISGSFSVTQVQLPAATTAAATNLTTTAAILNGSINPNGGATNAWFEWGTSDTLSTNSSTTPQAIGAGTSAVPVGASLLNLSPGTTYFFRAVGMNSVGTTRGSILSFTTPVQVTVQTNPTGRSFSVDGGPSVTTTQVLQWTPGSSHTITTTSPQTVADTQFAWTGWSDNGTISHTITAPAVNTTYTATFNTQYMLTMTAGAGGTVSPSSGFFNSGQSVPISATPNSGFIFNAWTGTGTGSFTGLTNKTNVTMTGPITQTASFLSTAAMLLVLEDPGQIPNQVLALDATSLLRDPFPVISPLTWSYKSDLNTRLTIFLKNFQPVSGELPSAVVVNLVGSNNQSFDVPAEDVRPFPNTDLTQVTFRLPNNLAIGTCVIKVTHNTTTNSGTLRIKL